MSYNRQPVAEDPMQIWGAVGVLLILLLFVIWLFLPEVVYASCLILHTLWGLVDWGPFHNYAAPRYNLLAMTGTCDRCLPIVARPVFLRLPLIMLSRNWI